MRVEDFISSLDGVTGRDPQWYAKCPAHNDNTPSLSVKRGDMGGIAVYCHKGCTPQDIAASMGLAMADLAPPDKPNTAPDGRWQLIATYLYHDADGNVLYRKRRYLKPDGKKTFSYKHPDGKGGWEKGKGSASHVPYKLPQLLKVPAVFLVEGEKDVDTLTGMNLSATTSPLGAHENKWPEHFTEWFKGKEVVVIPDNDDIGKRFAVTEATAIKRVARSVKLLDLTTIYPELPPMGDVTDLYERVGAEKCREMLNSIVPDLPEWELEKSPTLDKSAPNIVRAADVPYEPPRWLIPPYFQRGKGTMIQADNGTGKTAFTCAVAAHVSTGRPLLDSPVEAPGDVLILSVEDDLPVLRGRIEASGGDLTKCHFMTNAAGLTFNSPEVEEAIKQISARMVIFDPFQAFLGASVNMDKSNQTRPELAKLFEMADRNDCAVAIIAHIGKGSAFSSAVNRSLGSVDIPSAMRSILQLTRNPDDESECIAVHVKCSNAPKGRSISFTIGDRGGVHWSGYSVMTADDLTTLVKRKEKGVPYENEPLVQVFNQLITDRPGGGFWAYEDVKAAGMKMLGFPPFSSTADLKAKLNGEFARELQEHDGLIVTCGHKSNGVRGVRIEQYRHPASYQTSISNMGRDDKS